MPVSCFRSLIPANDQSISSSIRPSDCPSVNFRSEAIRSNSLEKLFTPFHSFSRLRDPIQLFQGKVLSFTLPRTFHRLPRFHSLPRINASTHLPRSYAPTLAPTHLPHPTYLPHAPRIPLTPIHAPTPSRFHAPSILLHSYSLPFTLPPTFHTVSSTF